MDLATLAIFHTVARELSITRPAGQLGRVPSNVTTRVQQLEEELGVVLFERDKKPGFTRPATSAGGAQSLVLQLRFKVVRA